MTYYKSNETAIYPGEPIKLPPCPSCIWNHRSNKDMPCCICSRNNNKSTRDHITYTDYYYKNEKGVSKGDQNEHDS